MSRLKRLIHEIHRRSLWQVLLIYVGAAWACFELIDAVTERFGFPEWLPALAVVLFLLGLPFVVATACVHELPARAEPPAEAEAGEVAEAAAAHREARRRHRFLTSRNAGFTFLVALAAWGVVTTGWLLLGDRGPASEVERKSIAVLPFDNLSPDPENEYFADGMHDEIIAHLSKIADLKVISRTSVMEYKDRSGNLRTIAEELNVTNILEGTVRRANGRVRITTQLIDALADEHLWTEVYDRSLSDVFAVQSDVAQQVAAALRAELTVAERERIEAGPTDNLQAYDYYLRGNQYFNRGVGSPDILLAVEMYERAVARDPAFALAFANLARAHARTHLQAIDRTEERGAKSLSAAERALELQPDLPEARAALGWHYYWVERDYDRALQEFAIALRNKPNDSDIVLAVGLSRRRHGQWDQALGDLRRAFELDPLSNEKATEVGISYVLAREYEDASYWFGRAISIAPDHHRAYMHLASAYIAMDHSLDRARNILREGASVLGRLEFAKRLVGTNHTQEPMWLVFDEFEEEYRSTPSEGFRFWEPAYLTHMAEFHARHDRRELQRAFADSALTVLRRKAIPDLRSLALAHAHLGHKDEAIRAAEEAIRQRPVSEDARGGPTFLWDFARVLAILGELDAAIGQLEYLFSMPCDVSVGGLALDPIWDPLRSHPRFQALLDKYQ